MTLTRKDREPVPRAVPRANGKSKSRRTVREFATELEAKRFADLQRLKGRLSIIHHPATSLNRKWAVAW